MKQFALQERRPLPSNLTQIDEKQAADAGLTFEQAIKTGYLTDEFASKTLSEKNVKLIFLENSPRTDCRAAEVYVEDRNYADLLILNGFNINSKNFNTVKEQAEKLNLVIYNHKSKKYHALNCKYGRIAHDAVILLKGELPSGAKPCKFCHVGKALRFESTKIY